MVLQLRGLVEGRVLSEVHCPGLATHKGAVSYLTSDGSSFHCELAFTTRLPQSFRLDVLVLGSGSSGGPPALLCKGVVDVTELITTATVKPVVVDTQLSTAGLTSMGSIRLSVHSSHAAVVGSDRCVSDAAPVCWCNSTSYRIQLFHLLNYWLC